MRQAWPLTLRGTAAGVLALAFFVASAQLGSVQLLGFGVFLLALVVMSLIALHITRRDVTLARTPSPPAVPVGGCTRITVHVSVRTALPTTPGTWEDRVPEGLVGRSDGRFPALGSGLRGDDRAVDLVYDLDATERGVHWLGPLELTIRDPFGIARRCAEVGDTTRLMVTPECVDLPPLTAFAGATGGMLHATTTRLGQGADNLVARPYKPGDSMRRIHWRATAHRDTLMVRQEEQESTPEATVVLDCAPTRWGADASTRPGADPLFEQAVTACVSAANALARDGYSVQVIDADGAPLSEPVPGGDHAAVAVLIGRFATTVAHGTADVATLARMWSAANTGPLVVITGVLRPADADALAALPGHSAHPVLLTAAPVDDALERAVAAGWYAASIAPGTDLREAWARVAHADAIAGVAHGFD
ncbi:DUF58 domain-containing protein [Microbacterium luticocti]|uniref:DUF58 domain-containing protein n=1 Tax=Microbacterium luticocti TaxID=451764 RepID=UPI000684BEB2|nr:DUF58 domain-containing protein [Microbacterium luticocti]